LTVYDKRVHTYRHGNPFALIDPSISHRFNL
jgi:hypothetical protein